MGLVTEDWGDEAVRLAELSTQGEGEVKKKEAHVRMRQQRIENLNHGFFNHTVFQPQLWFRGGMAGKIARQQEKLDDDARKIKAIQQQVKENKLKLAEVVSADDEPMTCAELLEVFEMFDEDGDGHISTEELVHMMVEWGVEENTEELYNKVTAMAGKDGELDFAAFCRVIGDTSCIDCKAP